MAQRPTISLQQRMNSDINRNLDAYYSMMSRSENIIGGKQKMAQPATLLCMALSATVRRATIK